MVDNYSETADGMVHIGGTSFPSREAAQDAGYDLSARRATQAFSNSSAISSGGGLEEKSKVEYVPSPNFSLDQLRSAFAALTVEVVVKGEPSRNTLREVLKGVKDAGVEFDHPRNSQLSERVRVLQEFVYRELCEQDPEGKEDYDRMLHPFT